MYKKIIKDGIEIGIYKGENLSKNTLALVSVKDHLFCVGGIALMVSHKGDKFLSFPSKKGKDGNYIDVAYPSCKEARRYLTEVIIDADESLTNETKKEQKGDEYGTWTPSNGRVGWSNLEHDGISAQ